MSKIKKVITSLLLVIAGAGGLAAYEFQRNGTPVIRKDTTTPLYTIGEVEGYGRALSAGHHVVKFGPMFFGLYPGGLAFRSPEEAASYLKNNGWDTRKWSIYLTSGDYKLDATDGFTNKSLIVEEHVSSQSP